MNHDVRTIKKYADLEELPEKPHRQKRVAKVMDPVKPILDQWLKEDSNKKRKFRRTAKRMFDMLIREHAFEGSYRAGCILQ